MKLAISYDFYNAICTAREPLSPYKVIRNKENFALVYSSLTLAFMLAGSMQDALIEFALGGVHATALAVAGTIKKEDPYASEAADKLKKLVPQLNDLYIATDYDLLLESELYHKKYNVEINEKKLPSLVESKYVLVPAYTYSGEIKDVSILQEHTVGSKQYVLSVGSPRRDYKLARNNA